MHTRTEYSGRVVLPLDKCRALRLYCGDAKTQKEVLAAIEKDRMADGSNAKQLLWIDVYFIPWPLIQTMRITAPTDDVSYVFEANECADVHARIQANVEQTCKKYGWSQEVREWLLGVLFDDAQQTHGT